MDMYIKLLIITIIPTLVSTVLYLLKKKGIFDRFSKSFKQIIAGLIFGIIACFGTEYGVDVGGALANARDAAIVTCGLVCGGPAGIIAGIIGGVYRWFAVYWGAGEFTRVACSVACILAGLIAAFVRKYMFEKKMPGWVMGLFLGTAVEVIHLNLLFFTNINDIHKTLSVLDALGQPMIICNGIGVALPILVITLLSGGSIFLSRKKGKIKIAQTVQAWLLGTVCLALVFSSYFTYSLQKGIADYDVKEAMESTIKDIRKDIIDASDENLLNITSDVAETIVSNDISDKAGLKELAEKFNVDEINLVNTDGIIIASTNDNYDGFDMKSGEQSKEFMCLVENERSYVQDYMPTTYDSNESMKYAGVRIRGMKFVQVGYGSTRFKDDIKRRIELAAVNKHVDVDGYIVITNAELGYESYTEKCDVDQFLSEDSGPELFGPLVQQNKEFDLANGVILDKDVFMMYASAESYNIIAVYPMEEAYFTRNIGLYANGFTELIIFAVLFVIIYILIRVIVVNNIYKINQSLGEIVGGNLDTVVDVRNNEEFSLLSNDINSTVDTLKRYIAEAASRIDAELQYAKDIQAAALPHISPNFEGKDEYELNACMFTAKEVGGDFYDFYYVDDSHLAITIADVSGKGIPAALFMMTSKTMLRNMVEAGMPIEQAMTNANARLCEGNDANMFVTVWAAVIDLKTGHVSFGNAGHNPPVVKKSDGKFEFLPCKSGLVLAGMDGVKYRLQEFDIEPGDVIYLYTDGVTEATNANNELYGNDRLIDALNEKYDDNVTMEGLCSEVKADVDKFVGEAPQFDDITMLAFRYQKRL